MDQFQKDMHGHTKDIAAQVARLSQLLTRHRDELPLVYLQDPALREAYISYFLPSNIKKIHIPLHELALHPAGLLSQDRLRILDIGCGPGSALLGVMEFFSQHEHRPFLELTALDHVPENLTATKTFCESWCSQWNINATITTVKENILQKNFSPAGAFDLILFSNVVNELFVSDENRTRKRAALVSRIVKDCLHAQGSCIIIEPALHQTSRDMLSLRDAMQEQGVQIYAPCLVQRFCPALANPKDWCHEDVPWEPPKLVQEIDRLTGLRKDSLKFSYLVLRKDSHALSDVCTQDAFRIVSEPLVSKGKIEYYICGNSGRRLVTRLNKDRTTANASFATLKRGDIAAFEQLTDQQKRYIVGKQTSVRILIQRKSYA